MQDFLIFLVNQKGEFFSMFFTVFIIAALVGFFLIFKKFELSLKGHLIASVIISGFVLLFTYSFGYSCYKDYTTPKEKTIAFNIDKSLDESVLNFLKINYEKLD